MRENPDMSTTPDSMTVLLCTDGSDLALSAIRQGLELLATPDRVVVLSVVSPVDPSLVTGTGFAGGVMSFEEQTDLVEAQREAAEITLAETVEALGLADAETLLKTGDAGHVIWPNILVIWGDDIGISNLSCYSDGPDGVPDAQHRPHRRRGCPVHRLLRRAELHRRASGVHHGQNPYRPA
jgi:hypothetical protein